MAELNEDAVKIIVKETINELRKNGYLKRSDDIAYSEISARLFEFFKQPESDPDIQRALARIKNDRYYQIITMYYRDRITIDWIAETFGCEISTITRNKRRLCLKIYRETE